MKYKFTPVGGGISNQKQHIILLFFLLVSVAIRFFSFFPSLLGHDESTYMIMGRDLLNGKLLYTDMTDTKPVGIFLFYAGIEFLFGSSIFMKRFVFAIVVGITAFLISKVSKKIFLNNKVAFASGVIYIFYTSIWNYHGRSPNTEILFNLFTIVGLLFFLKQNFKSYFLGGLAFGIGFIIKYLVLFDLFAILLYFFILEIKNLKQNSFWKIFSRYALACFAFTLPFGLSNLYFWLGNHFNDFYYVTYVLPGKYGSNPSLTRYSLMILDFLGKLLPISILVFYTAFKKNKGIEIPHKWLFTLWVVCILIAIYLPGKELNHYTIQLMIPFSLIAGIFFHPKFKKNRIIATLYSRKTGFVLLGIILLVTQFLGMKDDFLKPDSNREVATYLEKQLKPGDQVFVSNYEQIIYYLLEMKSPTKYVHSSLLFSDTHKNYIPNAEGEVKRIIDTFPKFVLVQRKNALVQNLIKAKYRLNAKFRNDEILIYKRID